MRKIFPLFIALFSFNLSIAQQEIMDTLVDIGGYKMHFYIIKGHGTPILFESGAGDGADVWDQIAHDVHEVTGTTVICYDRSGFGKSELNPYHKNDEDFGITNGVMELETSLQKLGYFNDLILVSHSYGGFYSTLFSARNPGKVKFNVRVDANLADQYTEDVFAKAMEDNSVLELKNKHLGMYYLGINFENTVRAMWEIEYPESVPAINIVSPVQRHHTDDEWNLLIQTHNDFVKDAPNRIGITAHGSGHYIFRDNPGLVVNAIVKAYASILDDDKEKLKVLNISLDKSMELFIRSMENRN